MDTVHDVDDYTVLHFGSMISFKGLQVCRVLCNSVSIGLHVAVC